MHLLKVLLPVLMLFSVRAGILRAVENPVVHSARADSLLTGLLDHYSSPTDSLKRAAAKYLIENMEGHGYVTYDLRDSTGGVVAFDVLSFADYERLESGFDSLEANHGALDFEKRDFVEDLSVVTAEFLISNIDLAFRTWRELPWAWSLSFEQFLEYVLPYRGSNEPLELWREPLMREYEWVRDRMTHPEDPVEAAVMINRDLMKWFHFDPRFYYHPTDQGYSAMKTTALGRCEDMTNLTIFAFRANGLAVTSDYTPYWANSGNNHAWNAIVLPNGEVIPFMGAEANPGEYRLANKLAKVYRKTYSVNRDNLAFQTGNPDALPRYLASKSYRDVTSDYVPVSDVPVKLTVAAPEPTEFAYLCVFNSGEWKPIHWSRVAGDSAVFNGMGRDVAYLPGYYIDEEIKPAGDPFVLTEAGEILSLRADEAKAASLSLLSTTRVRQEESTDSFTRSHLEAGTAYELFLWRNGWESVGKKSAGDGELVFEDVPADGLYWLVAEQSDQEERIFTSENGKQRWW